MSDSSAFEKDFVQLLRSMGRSEGMDDLLSSIFAICFIEPEPIAMEDIAKRTGYCLASVSTKVKLFEGIGMITRSSQPGTRKIFLYMEKDMKALFKNMLVKKVAVLGMLKNKMPEILSPDKVKTEKDKRKVQIVENYFKQAMKFLKIHNDMLRRIDAI